MMEAQKRAKEKYRKANAKKNRRWSYKATAKTYIKSATLKEIEELKNLLKERETEIMEMKYNLTVKELTNDDGYRSSIMTGTLDEIKEYIAIDLDSAEEINDRLTRNRIEANDTREYRVTPVYTDAELSDMIHGGPCRDSDKACDYILVEQDGEEIAYTEIEIPEDATESAADWSETRAAELVKEIKYLLGQ